MVQYGTAFVDTFRYGNTPILQKAWKERVEPFLDGYPLVYAPNGLISFFKNKTLFACFQTKQGMTDYVLSDTESAMLDNYNTRIYYDDYIKCETVDIPKKYFPMQYAMPIQKHLPYFDALYYHMNTMKVNKTVFWNHILSRILQKNMWFCSSGKRFHEANQGAVPD